ncbi:MAG: ABC transporter ATP-binding protein [Desulfohalobiaceae bacterium]
MSTKNKTAKPQNGALLQVQDLTVRFRLRRGDLTAVNNVSFTLEPGERMGVVGESGAGKSVMGFSLINLISKPGYIHSGSIRFEGRELVGLDDDHMRAIRGNRITMIFQDPMMTLNPVLTIGTQMIEVLKAHKGMSRSQAEEVAVDKLRQVYIPSPGKRLRQYPHEFSGGMRQRIVIAISLLTNPGVIIADEPTTALDVTIQAEIMDLLLELTRSEKMALILITHDLAVVSQVTEKIAVMYAGSIVEMGSTDTIISRPSHPYTQGLLAALPQMAGTRRLNQIPGSMPSLTAIPPGCAFQARCSRCEEVCRSRVPLLTPKDDECLAACHFLE